MRHRNIFQPNSVFIYVRKKFPEYKQFTLSYKITKTQLRNKNEFA